MSIGHAALTPPPEKFSPPSDAAAPLIRATRLSLAAKADRGEISSEDAEAELARVAFQAQQEQARTAAAVAAGNGVAMQGSAAPPTVAYSSPNSLTGHH